MTIKGIKKCLEWHTLVADMYIPCNVPGVVHEGDPVNVNALASFEYLIIAHVNARPNREGLYRVYARYADDTPSYLATGEVRYQHGYPRHITLTLQELSDLCHGVWVKPSDHCCFYLGVVQHRYGMKDSDSPAIHYGTPEEIQWYNENFYNGQRIEKRTPATENHTEE